ncbi:MAG TPA: hypothetical protein VFL42_02205, partial [Terriglobales bacterium]|nr:hypothetical protein [Terriglobales bacterium]
MVKRGLRWTAETLLLAFIGIVSSFVNQLHLTFVLSHLHPSGLKVFDCGPYLVMGLVFTFILLFQFWRNRLRGSWKPSCVGFILAALLVLPFCQY